MADSAPQFKEETISKLLQQHLSNQKIKVNASALKLITELLRVFVSEGFIRANKEAASEKCPLVTIEHFEKILPQLLLDF